MTTGNMFDEGPDDDFIAAKYLIWSAILVIVLLIVFGVLKYAGLQ